MVTMAPGEKVLRVTESELTGIGSGTLYITTHRLVFETNLVPVALVINHEDIEGSRTEDTKLIIRGHDDRMGRAADYAFTTPDPGDYTKCLHGACESKLKSVQASRRWTLWPL